MMGHLKELSYPLHPPQPTNLGLPNNTPQVRERQKLTNLKAVYVSLKWAYQNTIISLNLQKKVNRKWQ